MGGQHDRICKGKDEGGWDRVKSSFTFSYGDNIPDELKELSVTVFIASMAGFLFGGMIGARHAGDKFIALNHSTKYTSTMQAQRELHGAALLGFVRKGSHWGWRVGLFAGVFSGATLLLSLYRNKEDAVNYISAGAFTGGLFRVSRGVKPLLGGTLLGTLLSIPVGFSMHGLNTLLVSKEEKEKIQRNKIEARQNQKDKWEAKLQATSDLIKDIDDSKTETEGLKSYYKLVNETNSDSDESTLSMDKDSDTRSLVQESNNIIGTPKKLNEGSDGTSHS